MKNAAGREYEIRRVAIAKVPVGPSKGKWRIIFKVTRNRHWYYFANLTLLADAKSTAESFASRHDVQVERLVWRDKDYRNRVRNRVPTRT